MATSSKLAEIINKSKQKVGQGAPSSDSTSGGVKINVQDHTHIRGASKSGKKPMATNES